MLSKLVNLLKRERMTVPERALALYEQGVKLAEAGKHGNAVKRFTEAIRLSPNTGKLFHHRGSSLDAAVFDYDTAVRLDPSYPDTYLDRGNARHAMGELARALKDYSEAVRLRPNWAEAYANRAVVHAQSGNEAASASDAQKAVALGVDGRRLAEMITAARENAAV